MSNILGVEWSEERGVAVGLLFMAAKHQVSVLGGVVPYPSWACLSKLLYLPFFVLRISSECLTVPDAVFNFSDVQ